MTVQQSTQKFHRREDIRNLYGRSKDPVSLGNRTPHPDSGYRAITAPGQSHDEHLHPTPAPRRTEQMMRSVEGPPSDNAVLRPYLETYSRSLQTMTYRDGDSSRLVGLNVDTNYSPGKRRRVADPGTSPALREHVSSRENLPERTVLVPLDEYRETGGRNISSCGPKPGDQVVGPAHNTRIRPRASFTDSTDLTSLKGRHSVGNTGHGLIFPPATDGQSPRRPHLQVQLLPRAPAVQGYSPLNAVSAQSEYDQTLHSSHSNRSFLAPVSLARQSFSESHRPFNMMDAGGRRSERDSSLETVPPLPRILERQGYFPAPGGRDYYPHAGLENDKGEQVRVLERQEDLPVVVPSRRPGQSSPRSREAFLGDARYYPEASIHTNGTNVYSDSAIKNKSFPEAYSLPEVVEDLRYAHAVQEDPPNTVPIMRDTDRVRHTSGGTADYGRSQTVNYPYNYGEPVHVRYDVPAQPEASGTPAYRPITSPRHSDFRRDLVILD